MYLNFIRNNDFRSEFTAVWLIAWPLILTNLLNVTVGIIDFKMVGVLGVSSIAAVGMARQVMMLMMVLMLAISGGSSVLVAHAYGAGNKKKVSLIASKTLFFMLWSALFIVTPLGLFFSGSFLNLLGAKNEVILLGNSYLRILFAGSIFTMFNFAISGILLGIGKTKISLNILLFVNLINIPLNYFFIFGIGPFPELGVAGAALGTVLARALGSFIGIWVVISPRLPFQVKIKEGIKFDLDILKKIFFLGGPRSLQGIVRNISRLFTIRIITLLSDATRSVSAYSVGMQVKMISSFVGLAFMSAAVSRVGQNLGKKDIAQAEKSGWIAALIATLLMTFVAICFFLFPGIITSFFTDDKSVIELGKLFFIVIAVSEPVMAFSFALGGALRGAGDPVSPFIYGSVSDLLISCLLGYILAITLNLGFLGIAIALSLSAFTRAIPTMWKFRTGKWKKNWI